MSKFKIISVTLVAIFALTAGLYFSGYLTLTFLRLDTGLLKWDTYLGYYRALGLPELAPYVTRIKWGGYLGFGVPAAAWLFAAFLILKPKPKAPHGEARFAARSDLAKYGLFKDDPTGVIVGKYAGRFLKLAGSRHALLAAPTRSGKGVGFVIPNLLNFQQSVVVLDVKKEAFGITSGYRATLGPVYLFDPFADDLRTHRWNPLSYVDQNPIRRTGDLQAIANCLYKDSSGHDPFWTNMSRSTFVAAANYLFDEWNQHRRIGSRRGHPRYPTLGGVYRLLAGDGRDTKAFLQGLANAPFANADTRLGFASITTLSEQTFTSVIATTQAPLLIFANPLLDAATSANDFWLPDLRRKVQSLYVGVPPGKLSEASSLLNLFFEQAIKLNGTVLPEQDETLKYQCLFVLDEFTALGRVDIVVNAVGWLAGYGVRILCVIQSLSQLEATYGPDNARSMVTNLACQIVYTPREQRDAEEYSKMLGDTTVRRPQRTRSHGPGGGVSITEIVERRPLMLPQELKSLSSKKAIVFIEGIGHPVLEDKIFYFSDPFFKPRLQYGKVVVPPLRIGEEK